MDGFSWGNVNGWSSGAKMYHFIGLHLQNIIFNVVLEDRKPRRRKPYPKPWLYKICFWFSRNAVLYTVQPQSQHLAAARGEDYSRVSSCMCVVTKNFVPFAFSHSECFLVRTKTFVGCFIWKTRSRRFQFYLCRLGAYLHRTPSGEVSATSTF